MRLEDRTAFITGGTQGVGGAIAKRLAAAGCNLILQGLRQDEHAEDTIHECRQHGVDARAIYCDLAVPSAESVAWLQSEMPRKFSDISILINNVGTFSEPNFLEVTHETFERTMRLNVEVGYFLTQAVAKAWIAAQVSGRILFTGSINGVLAEPGHTVYDASKGAVHSLVRSLSVSLAPHRIRVNGMAPGLVSTPLTAPALDKAAIAWMKLHTPNGEVPGPESCAGAALFLVSDEAEHVQGQILLVDGGMSAWQQPDLPEQLRDKI